MRQSVPRYRPDKVRVPGKYVPLSSPGKDHCIPLMTQQNSLQMQNEGEKKRLYCAADSVLSVRMLSCGRDRVKDVHCGVVDEISHNWSHNSSSVT